MVDVIDVRKIGEDGEVIGERVAGAECDHGAGEHFVIVVGGRRRAKNVARTVVPLPASRRGR